MQMPALFCSPPVLFLRLTRGHVIVQLGTTRPITHMRAASSHLPPKRMRPEEGGTLVRWVHPTRPGTVALRSWPDDASEFVKVTTTNGVQQVAIVNVKERVTLLSNADQRWSLRSSGSVEETEGRDAVTGKRCTVCIVHNSVWSFVAVDAVHGYEAGGWIRSAYLRSHHERTSHSLLELLRNDKIRDHILPATFMGTFKALPSLCSLSLAAASLNGMFQPMIDNQQAPWVRAVRELYCAGADPAHGIPTAGFPPHLPGVTSVSAWSTKGNLDKTRAVLKKIVPARLTLADPTLIDSIIHGWGQVNLINNKKCKTNMTSDEVVTAQSTTIAALIQGGYQGAVVQGSWWDFLVQSGLRYNYKCGASLSSPDFLAALGVQAGQAHTGKAAGKVSPVMCSATGQGTYVRQVRVIKGAIRQTKHQEDTEARCRAAALLLSQNPSTACLICFQPHVKGGRRRCTKRGQSGHRPAGGQAGGQARMAKPVPITNGPGAHCPSSWRCTVPLHTHPTYAVPGVVMHSNCNHYRVLPMDEWTGGHVVRTLKVGTTGHMSGTTSAAQWGDDGNHTQATARTFQRVMQGVVTPGLADIFAFVDASDQFVGIGNWVNST